MGNKVLYIAGYSRSGSTVLGSILGNHPDIACVGEVTHVVDDWADSERACSCGEVYTDCSFWSGLFEGTTPDEQLAQVIRKTDRRSMPLSLLSRITRGRRHEAYGRFQSRLFGYARLCSGKSIIVDSSKTARLSVGRLLALKKLADQDVYVLHLVRNGLATMESLTVTGSNWAIEGHIPPRKLAAFRAVLGWVRANISAATLGRLVGRNRYMRIRYEDFLQSPDDVVNRISSMVGFDPGPILKRLEQDEGFDVGHVVGGNRVRFERTIKLKKGGQPKPGNHLNLRQRALFALVGGWLQRRYGYTS